MPSTRRGTRTRRHLIEQCAGVFDRNGFTGATLNQMVDASGYTRGAFYFHFESKDALAEAIVTDQAARWADLFRRVRAVEPDPCAPWCASPSPAPALYQSDIVVRAAARLLSERVDPDRKSLPQTYPWWISTVHALLNEGERPGR